MQRKTTLLLGLVLALAASAAAAQRDTQPEARLQAAITKESVEGDLPAAIELYKQLARSSNRAVAARALVRMGACYEKLGDSEARKAYERALKEFADQADSAAQARARLAALGRDLPSGQVSTRLVWFSTAEQDGADSGHSISSDGRYISYTDWTTGNLMLRDLLANAGRALTTAGSMKSGEQAWAPGSAISRDGRQIAYSWWDAKVKRWELRVANLNGEPNARRLLDLPTYIRPSDWSPDGKWIAAVVVKREGNQPIPQIVLILAQDGSLRTLKSMPESTNVRTFGFSPDGKYILYSDRITGGYQVRILSLDGKSDVPLFSEPSMNQFLSPVWTPDGSRIVFCEAARRDRGLRFVRVADGRPIGAPELITAAVGSAAYPIGFTRDGTLFYGAPAGGADIYIADLDPATGKLSSEPKQVNVRTQSTNRLHWRPDGKSVSYWGAHDGRTALVVHTLATGEERELWSFDLGAGAGRGYHGWFPDGSLLTHEVSGQNRILRRVDSQTMQGRASWTIPDYPRDVRNIHLAFAPDMMTAFFLSQDQAAPCDGPTCTFVMIARDIKTGRDREVLRLGAISVAGPSVSPDGRGLAFIARTRTGIAAMVAPTAGGAPRELVRGPGFADSTSWTQDGAHVLVAKGPQWGGEIWSVPVNGGAPVKSPVRMPVGAIAVSPDGTRIGFTSWGSRAALWAMTGLVPEAKSAPAR